MGTPEARVSVRGVCPRTARALSVVAEEGEAWETPTQPEAGGRLPGRDETSIEG